MKPTQKDVALQRILLKLAEHDNYKLKYYTKA